MKKSIYEILREYEFNKTEPETLVGLVEKALERSKEARNSTETYLRKSITLFESLNENNILCHIPFDPEIQNFANYEATGVDGSNQVVGGIGGRWYIPISCATVNFPSGLTSKPNVTVAANIESLDEREPEAVTSQAEYIMLAIETTAMKRCALDKKSDSEAIMFLDGPIIDPPFEASGEIVEKRCEAIKLCLTKNIFVLGIVKRVIGNMFIDHFSNFESLPEKQLLQDMYSDFNVACHVFTHLAEKKGEGIMHTKPFNMIELTFNAASSAYRDAGIDVYTMLFQNGALSKPIRVDIPVISGAHPNLEEIAKKTSKIIRAWSPPNASLPVPILIAHDKCNVRKGCAEVLYNEIINKSTGDTALTNLIRAKLSMEEHF